MWMIGRKKEQQILTDCLKSPRPEFLAIYGRRRVGKTYLIRQYFQDRFSFYSTGIAEGKTTALIENIKTMYSNGFSEEMISKALSLDIDFVKKALEE